MSVMDALVLTYFSLGVFDAWLTQRRIKDYGPTVETNKGIRRMAHHLGPQVAAIVGVMVPTVAIAFLLWLFQLPTVLALMVGFNFKRFDMQLASLEYEKVHKNIKKQIAEYNKLHGDGEASLPSDLHGSKPSPISSSVSDGREG